MKLLKTLLFEFREVLDRTIYGHWITDTNELIPVKQSYQHFRPLLDMAEAEGRDFSDWTLPQITQELYKEAEERGWVRVIHQPSSSLGFHGTRQARKRVTPIIKASAAQQDVDSVYISTTDSRVEERFNLPKERQEMFDLLNRL